MSRSGSTLYLISPADSGNGPDSLHAKGQYGTTYPALRLCIR